MYPHCFFGKILFECVKAAWGKFGIEVWPGAGKVKDRTEIVEFTGLELEDEGGFPVNIPDCQVNFGSIRSPYMEKLEGRIECKVSKTEAKSADKWRICERCSFQLGGNEG